MRRTLTIAALAGVVAGLLWLVAADSWRRSELAACRVEMVQGSGECEYWLGFCARMEGCVFHEFWPVERARMRQYYQEEQLRQHEARRSASQVLRAAPTQHEDTLIPGGMLA